MSLLDNIRNGGSNAPPIGSVNFVIYTMDILDDPAYIIADGNAAEIEESEIDESVIAVGFQGLRDFALHMQSNVPKEVLENGEFSSDSIAGTPFELGIVAEAAPVYELGMTTNEERREWIGEVEDMLQDALNNDKQFLILQTAPLFKMYQNVKLCGLDYEINVNQLNMVAFLRFQQMRVTIPEYGYTPVTSVTGDQNASTSTNGASQPQTPNQSVQDLL